MKKSEIEIGKTYMVKVSGIVVPVKIVSESQYGGWNGKNTTTGREVRIKSAAKCRREFQYKNDLAFDIASGLNTGN